MLNIYASRLEERGIIQPCLVDDMRVSSQKYTLCTSSVSQGLGQPVLSWHLHIMRPRSYMSFPAKILLKERRNGA